MENGKIFDRAIYQQRRNRAAGQWGAHDFLKREAAARLADATADVARTFPLALDLGCHRGELAEALKGRAEKIITCDMAKNFSPQVVCDEEFLPFADNIFDLVASALSLHHVNDLPGALIQIQRALKPDGIFLAILPGASSLKELRESIVGTAAALGHALSPRLSPLVEVRDAGALLQRAGFALPVVDSDTITVEYDTPFSLMEDLCGMGESNVLLARQKTFTPRLHLMAIAEYYQTHFANENGTVNATFEFVTMTGWKPHSSQQKPAARGSGQVNLGKVL